MLKVRQAVHIAISEVNIINSCSKIVFLIYIYNSMSPVDLADLYLVLSYT